MWVPPKSLPEGHANRVRKTLSDLVTHLAEFLRYPRLVGRDVCAQVRLAVPFCSGATERDAPVLTSFLDFLRSRQGACLDISLLRVMS